MGQAIAAAADRFDDVAIAAQIDAGDSIEDGLKQCDVAIDFSAAGAIEEICSLAVKAHRPLVIGTTGHSSAQREAIQSAARTIPIVVASNFSVGVKCTVLANRAGCEIVRRRFRGGDHRNSSRDEKGRPQWDGKDPGRNPEI